MENPAQILLYGSVLIAVALGLLVISLLVSYLRALKKVTEIKDKKRNIEDEAAKEADRIITEARNQASQIIQESQVKASAIIKEAGVLNEQVKNQILAEVSQVTNEYAKSYQEVLTKAKTDVVEIISNISDEVKKEATVEIQTMRQTLTQEIANAQVVTRKAIEDSLSKVGEEIEAYKKARFERIDSAVIDIIRQVSQRVIGKSLSTEEKEDLIIKSLEEAKKENVF